MVLPVRRRDRCAGGVSGQVNGKALSCRISGRIYLDLLSAL